MPTDHLELNPQSTSVLPAASPTAVGPPKIAQAKPAANIARRAAWLALAYVLVTGGLLAGLLMQLRDEAMAASKRELSAFAQLTAGHTFEVAFDLEQRLKLAEVTLSVATVSRAADQESIGPMLLEVVRNTRALKDILVLDGHGRVIYQANGTSDIGLDWSDQPYFAEFQANAARKFGLGAPLRRGSQASSNDWLIPVAHAWRQSSGEFAGVIVGLMDPHYFSKAWTFDSEIAGLSIALTAADGTLVMRQPFVESMLGRSLADQEMRTNLSQDRASDTLQARNPLSGQLELQAYRRVAAYPELLVVVAQPTNVALAGWQHIAWIAGASWVVASMALGGLGAWLAREMRTRGALEHRYYVLFNSIPHAVIVSDDESGKLLAFNDAAVEQYGWSKDDAAVGGGNAYLPQDFAPLAAKRQDFSQDAARLIQGQRHRNAQGALIDVELTVRPIDVNGRPANLTVAADVSDRLRAEQARKSAEDQLKQSQKMDVLGQLTGGIAHDFNNVLMVIVGSAEELAERTDLADATREGLDHIATSARRGEDLTRQMLAFSRKQPLRPRPTNVNDLVAETGKLLRRTLGEQIEIDSILADDLWTTDIDPVQLETSLVNLCLNARDAMPSGGRVMIETANVVIDRDQATREAGAVPGEFVLVTISDTGHGILPQHIDQIFEPFFTTKASGKGSGLGLSMVYGFVKQSHGHIAVTSEIDRGTSFRIYLRRHGEAAFVADAAKKVAPVGGSERVLVVEDDRHVRASVVRQLQSLGYEVSQAADGVAGVAAFKAASRPFDLLLTDVVMPGAMNGKALAEEAARLSPNTAVAFMSGYATNVLGDANSNVQLLNKPFRKSDLALFVRQVLDERGAGATEGAQ